MKITFFSFRIALNLYEFRNFVGMKMIARFFMAAVVALTLAACTGDAVERAVRDAFLSGDTTAARYDSICRLITADPGRYGQLLTEQGTIDKVRLQEFINGVGQGLRPPMTWNIGGYGQGEPSLTIYFERSGSMTPYDTPGGAGQLKKAVNDLINFFPGDKVAIHIVNDDIYPYRGSVDDFLQDRDIYASTAGVGNAATTDFKRIFEKILAAQPAGGIAVLVTDMIYSPADTRELSVDKIFNEEQSLAMSLMKKNQNKSFVVSRFDGDYHGNYYPYNGAPVAYHGTRPFYLIVIADIATLDRLAGDSRYARLLSPPGARHTFRFNQPTRDVDVSVVLDWWQDAGRYRLDRDAALTLTHVEGDRTTGKLSFSVAANLAPLCLPDDYVTDAAHYNVRSQSGYKLAIRHLNEDDFNNNNREYLEGKTHLLTFTGKPATSRDELTVELNRSFPAWVPAASTADDRVPDATTTFGLEQFLRGLYDGSGGDGVYTRFTIHLNQ